jgi:hypothetical protein
MSIGGCFLGGEGAKREDEHSSLSSDEVKNVWSFTSSTQYVFTEWYLITATDRPIFLEQIHTF